MKRRMITLLAISLMATFTLAGCQKKVENTLSIDKGKIEEVKQEEKETIFENPNYEEYVDTKDIKYDVEKLHKKFVNVFAKYIEYTAPNGKVIPIVAQEKVTDEQLLKAYNVLSFYLTGNGNYDMSKVANQMADTKAMLVMPNGADGDTDIDEDMIYGQPLYQMETPVTGDEWYIKNDYEHRDASYEEILHMVHDNGIGTVAQKGVLPKLQKNIQKAQENALPANQKEWGKKGLWGYNAKDWLMELQKEGSLEQEYLASVVDSYYGLWSAFPEKGGMWGIYIAKNRQEIKEKDAIGYEVIESFLPKNFTYMDRVSPDFTGTFKMSVDAEEKYTYKSQYITNVRLTGEKNSNITANNRDNIIIGNKGNNILDGKEGYDIVQFSGKSSEYEISNQQVKDKRSRDGVDTLLNIEVLRFTDKDIILKQKK